jgi:hypothetical protein
VCIRYRIERDIFALWVFNHKLKPDRETIKRRKYVFIVNKCFDRVILGIDALGLPQRAGVKFAKVVINCRICMVPGNGDLGVKDI